MSVKFSDLIDAYPEEDTPEIQTLISGKLEFRELSGTPKEAPPTKGSYFKHQIWVQRYLVPYDRLFLFHKTGTGKSCTIVASAEYFKRQYELGNSTINRVYVIVKGDTLATEFKKEIACKCTAGDYIPKSLYADQKQQKTAITRSIKKWYSIKTYQKFSSNLSKMTDDQIIKEYSGSMFFVDEVHNLRNDGDDSNQDQTINTYNQFHRLFHLIKRSKVVVASATPMINSTHEIARIMNLILPENQQMPMIDYDEVTLEEMEPYLTGKVSYVRELDTGAIPEYQGEVLDVDYDGIQAQSVIYECPIVPDSVQAEGYSASLEIEESWRENKRQASNFVFPDGSWGGNLESREKKGLGKYVRSEGEDSYQALPELQTMLRDPRKLKQHSIKYYNIVNILKTEPGNAFVYDEFKFGSGVIILGLTLEANGFARFMETTSVFTGGSGQKGYCTIGSDQRLRTLRLDKRLRFGLLTSDTPAPRRDAMLELFNSYENRYGEYLKAIIGSPMSRDGLNLANGQIFINVGPGWHQSGMYQAMSRIIRATSHVELIKEMIANGVPEAEAKIPVKIYNMAATLEDEDSSDMFMYEYAETKDIEVKKMERILKQCAVDCQSHYKRNVRDTDVNGSKDCDYSTCRFECVDPEPEKIDMSTWKLLYATNVVEVITQRIKNFYIYETRATFDSLVKIMSDIMSKKYPIFLIYRSLYALIDGNVPIINSLGINTYLRSSGNVFYTVIEYPIREYTPLDSTYNEQVPLIEYSQFDDYLKARITEQEIKDASLDITQASVNTQILLFEREFNPENLKTDLVKTYSKQLFVFPEPIETIEEKRLYLASKGKGKGRRPKDPTQRANEKEDKLDEDEVLEDLEKKELFNKYQGTKTGERVFLHSLYGQESGSGTSYGVTARFLKGGGRLRLLKPSEGVGWRDLQPQERLIYGPMVQYVIIRRNKDFFEKGIFGTVLADGKFRVRAKADKKRLTAKGKKDNRGENTGRICKVWDKVDLLKVFWKLEIPTDYTVLPKNFDYEQSLKFLEEQGFGDRDFLEEEYEPDALRYFSTWYFNFSTVDDLCEIIYKYFDENELLFKS